MSQDPESQFALVEHSVISEVVAARAASLAKMEHAIGLIQQGHADAAEAENIANRAHGGTGFYLNERNKTDTYRRLFESFDAERSRTVYREHLDARIWMHLLSRAGLSDLMDKTAKDKLYEDLCRDGVPEATEENIAATFRHLAGEAHLIFQRGLARAFTELDRRFKSHDGFKLGARVVFTRVFDVWGQWNYHSRMFETLADVQRAFAILDGNRPSGSTLLQQIQQDRRGSLNPRQSETVTAYFKVRGFKNGNAHLWFMRDDLVEKANKVLADYYGEVLPDAVPKPGPKESDLRSQGGALAKDLSFYPTPEAVVALLLRDTYISAGQRILEPSAGTGNIVRGLLATTAARVDAIEIDPGRVGALRAISDPRLRVTEANFLQMHPTPVYDHVVMNPPFYGTHWMEHVTHAFDFLAPGGTLISVLPISAELGETAKHEEFRRWAEARKAGWSLKFHDLPSESFATSGTRINTVYLKLCKASK